MEPYARVDAYFGMLEELRALLNVKVDLEDYETNRLVRSSVEREFIIIGEAMAALSRVGPDTFDSITRASRIVDFRNQLTHEYPTVDNALVWAIIEHDVPLLRKESMALMGLPADTEEEG